MELCSRTADKHVDSFRVGLFFTDWKRKKSGASNRCNTSVWIENLRMVELIYFCSTLLLLFRPHLAESGKAACLVCVVVCLSVCSVTLSVKLKHSMRLQALQGCRWLVNRAVCRSGATSVHNIRPVRGIHLLHLLITLLFVCATIVKASWLLYT